MFNHIKQTYLQKIPLDLRAQLKEILQDLQSTDIYYFYVRNDHLL